MVGRGGDGGPGDGDGSMRGMVRVRGLTHQCTIAWHGASHENWMLGIAGPTLASPCSRRWDRGGIGGTPPLWPVAGDGGGC